MAKDLNILRYTQVYPNGGCTMETTTIKIYEKTKNQLDLYREYKNESYDEVIQKIIFIAKTAKKNPKLSQETIEAIEKARARIKSGKLITEEEAKKRLGF
jgi:hypothetical protein